MPVVGWRGTGERGQRSVSAAWPRACRASYVTLRRPGRARCSSRARRRPPARSSGASPGTAGPGSCSSSAAVAIRELSRAPAPSCTSCAARSRRPTRLCSAPPTAGESRSCACCSGRRRPRRACCRTSGRPTSSVRARSTRSQSARSRGPSPGGRRTSPGRLSADLPVLAGPAARALVRRTAIRSALTVALPREGPDLPVLASSQLGLVARLATASALEPARVQAPALAGVAGVALALRAIVRRAGAGPGLSGQALRSGAAFAGTAAIGGAMIALARAVGGPQPGPLVGFG